MSTIILHGALISDNGKAGILIEGFGHHVDAANAIIERNGGGGVEVRIPTKLKNCFWYPQNADESTMWAYLNKIYLSENQEDTKNILEKSPIWEYMKDKSIDLSQLALAVWEAVKS